MVVIETMLSLRNDNTWRMPFVCIERPSFDPVPLPPALLAIIRVSPIDNILAFVSIFFINTVIALHHG